MTADTTALPVRGLVQQEGTGELSPTGSSVN